MTPSPPELSCLRLDTLRKAVDIYMARAYPDGNPPEAVRKRLNWPADVDAAQVLTRAPWERANKPGTGAPAVYALRLGNARYPHMKLQVQPWPNASGFLLSVNTHDQVLALDPSSEDAAAFRAIQTDNQHLKEQIEQAWDEAGLPIFLRYLREYISAQSGSPAPPPAGS